MTSKYINKNYFRLTRNKTCSVEIVSYVQTRVPRNCSTKTQFIYNQNGIKFHTINQYKIDLPNEVM